MQDFFLSIVKFINNSLARKLDEDTMIAIANEMAAPFQNRDIIVPTSKAERMHATIEEFFRNVQDNKLPISAPELYKKGEENPLDFFRRVWGKYAEAGLMYQFHLRELDSTLYQKLHEYCSYRGINMEKDLNLPPKKLFTQTQAHKDKIDASGVRAKKALQQRAYRSSGRGMGSE